MTNWQSMPMITCPHCKQEFQVDDYYLLDVDDTFDCQKCDKGIKIVQKDTVVEVDLEKA